MATPALQVTGLGKRFRHRGAHVPTTFRKWAETGFKRRPSETFWALRGLDLTVAPGEMIGVIGRNGAGKSTLLRLLGGVMRADEGKVQTAAPVNGLLELNTGMHPDLSGRENIIINGVLGGLLRSEVEARLDQIVAFAELADHINDPVRTYSSGMKLRLGFSIAVHVEPKILLIDEVLAVGDIGFQQKCLDRIRAFKDSGCAIVLISHDLGQISAMCDRALWLDRGQMRALGPPEEVIAAYEGAMAAETARRTAEATADTPPDTTDTTERIGSLEAEMVALALLDTHGHPARQIAPGDGLTLRTTIKSLPYITGWHLSVNIADINGISCLDVNTDTDGVALPPAEAQMTLSLQIDRLDLAPGPYSVSVGLWHPAWEYAYEYRQDALALQVGDAATLKGLMSPPRHWQITAADPVTD